jgi:signal transduction histidine kinase
LEKQPFTLLELIEGCHSTFNLTCQNKGISLTIDNQFKGEYPVLGDITALKQMLFNVLGNAVKFTEHGTVSLTAAPHAASQAGSSPGVIFTIIDTGKGIQEDAIAHIFNAFTQEDKSITRAHGGCGLGLNIAQNLAQLMGGEITCTSSVGHGSKFEILVYLERQ